MFSIESLQLTQLMTAAFIILAILHLCQTGKYLIKVKTNDVQQNIDPKAKGDDIGDIDHSAEEDLEEFANSAEDDIEDLLNTEEDVQEEVHPAEEPPEEIVHPVEEEIVPESKVDHEDIREEEPEEARVDSVDDVVHPADEPAEEIVHPVEEEIIPESRVDHEDMREKEPEEATVVENKSRRMFRTKKHHSGDKYGSVECKYNCAGWPDSRCGVIVTGTLPSNLTSISDQSIKQQRLHSKWRMH